MGLFSRGKKGRSVALIDIGSASVGGAYARYEAGQPPAIYYTTRVAIEPRADESVREAMLRALVFLGRLMTEEGAPQLRRETGSGAVAKVLVSVAAPWQETRVRTVTLEEKRPFAFSKRHIDEAMGSEAAGEDRTTVRHAVLATILNGYETENPFGKRVTRAEIVLLSSTLDSAVARLVRLALRQAFHTDALVLTSFAPVAYEGFRELYPHQKDFIVLDVSGAGTDLIFVKRGLLASVGQVQVGTHALTRSSGALSASLAPLDPAAVRAWRAEIEHACAAFAETETLPHTIFLLADKDMRAPLKQALEGCDFASLWLSNEPPSVITMTPAVLASRVRTRALGEGDLFLALIALFAARSKD